MIGEKIKSIFIEGILYLALIIFVLCSSLCLSGSLLSAMVLAECAYICKVIYMLFFYEAGNGIFYRVKLFFYYVIPGAIAIFIISIAGIYLTEPTFQNILNFVAKIVVLVLAFLGVVPVFTNDKIDDKLFVRIYNLSSAKSSLYKLLGIVSRSLIIIGLLLIIFAKSYSGFYFESLVIIGCVVWYCREVLRLYCWWNYEGESDDESSDEPIEYEQEKTVNSERTISDREVKRIVQNIADRWTGKEDFVLAIYEGGGSIKYSVTVEVEFKFITYTINGKFSGVREEKLRTAHTYAESKINNVAFKIAQETESELSKHNLPYSYEINVKMDILNKPRRKNNSK